MALTLEELHAELADPNNVALVSPDGEFGVAPGESVQDAFKRGYRKATPEEIQKEIHYKEFGEGLFNETMAGTLGALRGITFGLSDPIIAKGGQFVAENIVAPLTGGEIRQDITVGGMLGAIEEGSPAASLTGEVIGAVAPAILTGGTSAPASAGAIGARGALGAAARYTPAGASALLGTNIAGRVAGAAGGGALARAAGIATAGAVEGGLYGAGEAVSAWALEQDAEFNAESILASAGTGLLTGGVAGGVLGIGGELVRNMPRAYRALGNKFAGSLEQGANSVSPAVSDAAGKVKSLIQAGYAKSASALTGVPEAEINQLFKPLRDIPEADTILKRATGATDADVDSLLNLRSKLSKGHEENISQYIYRKYKGVLEPEGALLGEGRTPDEILKEFNLQFNPRHMREVINASGVSSGQALTAAQKAVQKFDEISLELADNPQLYLGRGISKEFNIINYMFKKDMSGLVNQSRQGALDTFDVYDLILQTRKNIDNLARFDQNIPARQRATINKIKEMRAGLAEILMDPAHFGHGASEIAETRMRVSDYLTAHKRFQKEFGVKVTTKTGAKKFVLKPSAFRSFFRDPDRTSNALKKEALKDMLKESRRVMGMVSRTTRGQGIMDTTFMQGRATDAVSNLAAADQEVRFLVDVMDRTRLFSDIKSQASGLGVMELLPIAGGMSFGAPGGVGGAAIAGMLRTAKDPALTVMALNQAKHMAGKTTSAIGRGIAGLGKIGQTAAGIAPGVPVGAAVVSTSKQERPQREYSYSEFADLGMQLQNHPEVLDGSLAGSIADLEAVSPLMAGVLRERANKMSQFIVSKMPTGKQLDPLEPNRITEPTPAEKRKFSRYMRAVNDPLSVFDDMSRGVVSAEGAEVLRELYPAIYSEFYQKAIEAIAQNKISRRAKLELKSALGIGDGEVMIRQQSFNMEKQGPQATRKEPPKRGRKLARSGVDNLVNSERTTLQDARE